MSHYVYRFLNNESNIIYVGITRKLDERLSSHFSNGHLDEECYKSVEIVEFIETVSEVDAALIEVFLINKWQPLYNRKNKYEQNTLTVEIDISYDWKVYKFSKKFKKQKQNYESNLICKLDNILEERKISALALSKNTGVKLHIINEIINNKDKGIRKKAVVSIMNFLCIKDFNDFYYFKQN